MELKEIRTKQVMRRGKNENRSKKEAGRQEMAWNNSSVRMWLTAVSFNAVPT